MEVVIPPRDHGQSTFRYTWDEYGDVMQVTRVPGQPQQQQQQQQSQQPSMSERTKVGRQTVQWPFQSIVTETEVSGSPVGSHFARRATWEPRGLLSRDSDSDTTLAKDLVPDYVINYMRGETPESLARRQRNGGKQGEREVGLAYQHRAHQSRAAEFEGFYDEATPSRSAFSRFGSSSRDDERHILPGSGAPDAGWRRLLIGWRAGIALNVLLSFLVLVAGFVCLILAISKASITAGESVIYAGSCAMASHINWALHAAISVFAIVLVAGANYVFQVLSSPTRAEVDAAHEKKKWLDIGIPSVRNFRYIANSRVFLAIIILLAAMITLVIYNAVIFTSQTTANYSLVFVTRPFLTGAPFSNATTNNQGRMTRLDILALQDRARQNTLVNLTTTDCLGQFGGVFESDFQSVLLVTDVDSPNSALVQTARASTSFARFRTIAGSLAVADLDARSVQFCLAQPADAPTCRVSLNGSLLGIVSLLNLASVVCVAVVLFKPSFDPLVSLGDALRSFLHRPDPTTTESCLMTKIDVWQGRWGFREPKYWIPHDLFWLRVPSFPRWCVVVFLWAALVALAATGLAFSVSADPTGRLSAFGAASSHTIFLLPSSTPASGAALLASLPQLVLGALYLSTNSLVSTYYLSHESSLFALGEPRPLRVSSRPEGQQITSLFLTLPRPWSWFLAILFAAMAFVLSQSIFVVSIRLVDSESTTTSSSSAPSTSLVALGLSGTALLILLSLLLLLLIAVAAPAFRRAPPATLANGLAVGNPLAMPGGSCSAVLSARCHPSTRERADRPWRRALVWGVVRGAAGMEAGHCAYSAVGATQLDVASSYV